MATERNIIRQIVVCMVSLLVTAYAVIVARCPTDIAERATRAIKICSSIERYHCMNNTEHLLEEECIDFKQLPPGHYPIYNSFATGNPIDYEKCPQDRYQPWPAKSYEITECVAIKSPCASEGQVLCNTGSESIDITCQCDHRNGYVSTTGKCCNPLGLEDCSCFKNFKNDNIKPDVGCNCAEMGNSPEIRTVVNNTTNDTFIKPRYTTGNNDYRYIFFNDGNPVFITAALCISVPLLIIYYIFLKNKYTKQKYVITTVLTLVVVGCCVLNIWLYKDEVFLKYHLVGILIVTLVAITVCISGIFIVLLYERQKEVYDEEYEVQIFRLLKAAEQGNVNTLKSVANEKCIDMGDVDYDGRNALHVAVCAGQVKAVKYILRKKYCKINAIDRWNCSALDYASKYNFQDIQQLLEKYKDNSSVQKTQRNFKSKTAAELIAYAEGGIITNVQR